MLLQTNSYIVPKERRAEHARLIRRFRQALSRVGCDQFEVYEQVGANWSPGGTSGRYVQIMRFRDRQHQQAVQQAERNDPGSQQIIAEFCELINFPYQQQHGYFATGFYTSVSPGGPRSAIDYTPQFSSEDDENAPIGILDEEAAAGEYQEVADEAPADEEAINETGEAVAEAEEELTDEALPGEGEEAAAELTEEELAEGEFATEEESLLTEEVAETEAETEEELAPLAESPEATEEEPTEEGLEEIAEEPIVPEGAFAAGDVGVFAEEAEQEELSPLAESPEATEEVATEEELEEVAEEPIVPEGAFAAGDVGVFAEEATEEQEELTPAAELPALGEEEAAEEDLEEIAEEDITAEGLFVVGEEEIFTEEVTEAQEELAPGAEAPAAEGEAATEEVLEEMSEEEADAAAEARAAGQGEVYREELAHSEEEETPDTDLPVAEVDPSELQEAGEEDADVPAQQSYGLGSFLESLTAEDFKADPRVVEETKLQGRPKPPADAGHVSFAEEAIHLRATPQEGSDLITAEEFLSMRSQAESEAVPEEQFPQQTGAALENVEDPGESLVERLSGLEVEDLHDTPEFERAAILAHEFEPESVAEVETETELGAEAEAEAPETEDLGLYFENEETSEEALLPEGELLSEESPAGEPLVSPLAFNNETGTASAEAPALAEENPELASEFDDSLVGGEEWEPSILDSHNVGASVSEDAPAELAGAAELTAEEVSGEPFDPLLDDAKLLDHAPPLTSSADHTAAHAEPAVAALHEIEVGDEAETPDSMLEFEEFLRELENPSADPSHRSH